LINSSPAGGPHSGKTVSFTNFSNTSASDLPLKRKGSAITSAFSLRRSKEFESALAMAAVADNYSNPPVRVPAMMTRGESDGERREREKMVHEMQREWRRALDRVARREAQDERAHAFYWKHCFREMEIRSLNRKKKDVSMRKRGVLHKLLARAGTNLFLQASVFPLPLKWLMAKETAAALRDTSKSPRGAGQRRGSLSAAAAATAAADGSQRCVSPFRPIVRKVFENNKRLLSLRNQFDYCDEDAQNRPGNLPPNEVNDSSSTCTAVRVCMCVCACSLAHLSPVCYTGVGSLWSNAGGQRRRRPAAHRVLGAGRGQGRQQAARDHAQRTQTMPPTRNSVRAL
jgi:hypothetical protein